MVRIMSDADRADGTVSADGITVRKTLNAEQSDSATVVLKIRSDRAGAATIQLRETLPDGVTEEAVGFHPDYGDEYWSVAGETVVFERSFAPDEEFTTVYGVRDVDEGVRDQLEADPELDIVEEDVESEPGAESGDASAESDEAATGEEAEPGLADEEPDELEDIVSEDNSQPVQEVIAGERDTLPGLASEMRGESNESAAEGGSADTPASAEAAEGESDGGDDSDIAQSRAGAGTETAFGADDEPAGGEPADEPTADERTGDEPAVDEGGDDSETESAETDGSDGAAAPPTDVASALAEQLRAGAVSESDKKVLREQLGVDNSTAARVDHLQSEVSELAAYTEALESFIDEEGTAQQVLDDLSTETERLDDRLADIERRLGDDLEDLGGEIERLDDSLRMVEERLDGHDERLDSHETRIEMAEGQVSDVETEQSALESDVAELRESVDEMEEFRERLTDTLSRLTGGVEPESDE
jgi:outer membrane murein-binding lipoprotein Lpp